MDTRIRSIHARQVMDCKFRPVLEAAVVLECGITGQGAAPTGTSVGSYEAEVLRDNDKERFHGLSVFQAIENVNTVIAPALKGMDIMDQRAIDERMIELDGTMNKSRLGGNAIYSVSIACLRAAAEVQKKSVYQVVAGEPLKTVPLPTANSIIGGPYANYTVCFQEFTFCPYKAKDMTEAMEIIFHVHREIGEVFSREWGGQPGCRLQRIRKRSCRCCRRP